ncbi:MAG: preprotein translocase subunit SecA [Fusobacteria bacterium]|nr:preprotein translocase subunit SecA [Fusobacteriota bacterium]
MLRKIFGSKNDREIKRIRKIVEKVNALEEIYSSLSDDELRKKTLEFKEYLSKNEDYDNILVEAFAVVREAGKRVLNMRHYDVQLIGGVILHEGKIAEMKTGEGKTLVATTAVYLNALSGRGVHVITVNDYLAERDRNWMGRIYEFLGLTVGVILNGMENEERKAAYNCDITYGTNNEFGFDYLRDNMVISMDEKVQRELNYAIVDEVDSILIDEARTPLIISGPAEDTTKWYKIFSDIALSLQRCKYSEGIKDRKNNPLDMSKVKDYEVDEEGHSVTVTENGIKKVEQLLKIDNLYAPENVELTHYLTQALRAKELFNKDKEYVVIDEEVVIVDEFTGRLMKGRRYSDGLHQAIEAKEKLHVAGENQTLATITLQNYFRMYNKLAGMTGTAETEATEFMHIYKLPVRIIPTNRNIQRVDKPDLIYKTAKIKIDAIVKKIEELYKKGQPVLVGTASIGSSELLSEVLKSKQIKHNVLNAKYHEKEAEIVAQAGRYNAVTIATNMAGRGTDIILGGNPEFLTKLEVSEDDPNYESILKSYVKKCEDEKNKVLELGGLYIIGTERHESRRIDNQLRGRAGRQGDPGVSEFYLSLEDDLLRLFGTDRIKGMLERLGFDDSEPITHGLVTKSIEGAQRKVEGRNFSIRKQLLEYDDVMNKQRGIIYEQRNRVLEKDCLKEELMIMLKSVISKEVDNRVTTDDETGKWIVYDYIETIKELYNLELNEETLIKMDSIDEIKNHSFLLLSKLYDEREEEIGKEVLKRIEKYILLEIVDNRWKENLKTLDSLREGIHLRAYGQKDPVVEYKTLSVEIYVDMIETIKRESTSFLFKLQVKREGDVKLKERKEVPMFYNNVDEENTGKQKPMKNINKIGRNDPCNCGSGKKYKHCCGR